MIFLLLNLLLTIFWAALSGGFSGTSLLMGYVIGFAALWFVRDIIDSKTRYFRTVLRSIRLFAYFMWELLLSSVQVARAVLSPRPNLAPALVEVPLDVKSDLEIMLVANLITLTPGTLSVDVSEDRSTLLIHALFASDPEAAVAGIKAGMERAVKEVFEP